MNVFIREFAYWKKSSYFVTGGTTNYVKGYGDEIT